MSSAGDIPVDDSLFNLEYKSRLDNAWYSARVVTEGDTLTVKLQDFPQTFHDEVFKSSDFAKTEAVDEFRQRFRPLSKPVEDNECSKVLEGMIVCATFKEDGQVRFFDAVVEAVNSAEHSSEKCTCKFLLFWQQGPEEGNITSTDVANICLLGLGKLDSRVDSFINLVKERINLSEKARQFTDRGLTTEEREIKYCHQGDQDNDVGGRIKTGDCHYVIIDNLEKDLSPSSVIEFIYKKTSVMAQVYVFPGLASESCTRGVIVLDCKTKLMRIYEFLSNPNHFIVSLTGRPWVIAESMPMNGPLKMTVGSLSPISEYTFQNKDLGRELKVALLGTEEYLRAKKLRGLYDEFHNHLYGLRKRLALEEKRLLHPSSAVQLLQGG